MIAAIITFHDKPFILKFPEIFDVCERDKPFTHIFDFGS